MAKKRTEAIVSVEHQPAFQLGTVVANLENLLKSFDDYRIESRGWREEMKATMRDQRAEAIDAAMKHELKDETHFQEQDARFDRLDRARWYVLGGVGALSAAGTIIYGIVKVIGALTGGGHG